LLNSGQISDNDIWPRHKSGLFSSGCAMQRRHDKRLRFAVNDRLDLNWLHRRANGNFSNQCARVRGTAKGARKLF
jgi:hypothetical protein